VPPAPSTTAPALTVGLVGSGFRAQAFLELAARLPSLFGVTGVVTRSPASGAAVTDRWDVPAHLSLERLVADRRPDLVVTAVPAAANADLLVTAVGLGLPVLSETPPAPDVEGLRRLWAQVGASGLVQVAEQYPALPHVAARLAAVRAGLIGRPTSAQISATHLHHAAALIRAAIGAGGAETEIRATATAAPLADPVTRAGWVGGQSERPVVTTIATLDFGEGRTGLYDYTENQMRNPLRSGRMVIRGSRGEIVDDRVVRLVDDRTVVESSLVRRQTGQHLDLETPGLDHISLDGEVLYRNPFRGAGLSDDEIAMATMVAGVGASVRGHGAPPYPLAVAAQDALLGFAVQESVVTGRPVRTAREPWAGA
jgi:predicted dehydrogenase